MNTERMETSAERELSAYRAEIRNMKAEDVDLESIERGILERVRLFFGDWNHSKFPHLTRRSLGLGEGSGSGIVWSS
jgi:hypothetical protein